MIKRSSPGKARDILVACCKRKEGNGIWSIARELMRPYSTIRGWLVRMVRRGLRSDPLLFFKPAHPTFQARFRQAACSASHNNL